MENEMNIEEQKDKLVSLIEAAKLMGRTYATVHSYVKNKTLPGAVKMWGTRWFIPLSTVKSFIQGEISVAGTFATKSLNVDGKKTEVDNERE